jgi:hypothetical protein
MNNEQCTIDNLQSLSQLQMYVYPRPLHEPNTVQKLHDFAAKAYEEVVGH